MTTKMVVQKELRALIHPELTLINVDGKPENSVPEDVYVEVQDEQEQEVIQKESVVEKVKDFLHI